LNRSTFTIAASENIILLELVAVPEDAGLASVLVGLDVDALLDLPPRRLGEGRGVKAVVLAEHGADGAGGLHGVVVRDGREEVVRDVRVGDAVEEGPPERARRSRAV